MKESLTILSVRVSGIMYSGICFSMGACLGFLIGHLFTLKFRIKFDPEGDKNEK